MKKSIIVSALIAAAVIPASAVDTLVTWCGKEISVIEVENLPEDFSAKDLENYYQSLNFELCGAEGGYTLKHN